MHRPERGRIGARLFSALLVAWILSLPLPTAGAGESGRFHPGAFAPGVADTVGATRIRLAAGEADEDVDVVLAESGGSLRGRVLGDSAGVSHPLAGVLVAAVASGFEATAYSDADGVFRLGALPPGLAQVRIATDAPNSAGRAFAADAVGVFEVRAGETGELGDRVLLPGAVLTGSVIRAEDALPEPGVIVEAVGVNGTVVTAHPPDEHARFVLGGLPPGSYTVRVLPASSHAFLPEVLGGGRDFGAATFLTVGAGERGEVGAIALDRGAEVSGRISVGSLGRPLPGVEVHLLPRSGGAVRVVTTDEFGLYVFLGVPAGTYIVYVPALRRYFPDETTAEEARDLVLDEGDVRIRVDVAGTTLDGCSLPPDQQGAITGFVDLDFTEVQAARIEAVSARDTLTVAVEGAGFYTLGCVPPGIYRVGLLVDGPFPHQYHRREEDPDRATLVAVDADTAAAIDFAPPAGVTIAGRVRASDGGDVPGAAVRLHDPELREIARTVADEDGRYLLSRRPDGSGIPAGSYYVAVAATRVPAPEVTPIAPVSFAATANDGVVALAFRLPAETVQIRLRRAADPMDLEAGGGASLFEGPPGELGEGPGFGFEDRPPVAGSWWYALDTWGGQGAGRALAGPVEAGDPRHRLGPSLRLRPNPWDGRGEVELRLAPGVPGRGTLHLHDAQGRRVTTITLGDARTLGESEPGPGGEESVGLRWAPRDHAGRPLPSGVYYLGWHDLDGAERAATRWVVLR